MGWKETYVLDANSRVAGHIETLRVLLCDVIDGTVDIKDVSDSLCVLEEIQADYTVMSETVRVYDLENDDKHPLNTHPLKAFYEGEK